MIWIAMACLSAALILTLIEGLVKLRSNYADRESR